LGAFVENLVQAAAATGFHADVEVIARDAGKFRDGLTTDGMEITGFSGWFVRNFMDNQDVMGQNFREKGVEKMIKQAGEGGGWMVITSDGTSVGDLFECGRRFQRMALLARDKMIAVHPMTQTLEEKQGQKISGKIMVPL
jgi:hypothetical protein